MMDLETPFPNGTLSLPLLMERFSIRKSAHNADALVGICPVNHGVEAVFDCKLTDTGGWRITLCEFGCSPAEIWNAGRVVDQREMGDDEGGEEEPKPSSELSKRFIHITRDGLLATPPDRNYLLRDANTGDGIFIRGRVGILGAAGGSGKSWILTQLAVALATGTTWFGPRGWAPTLSGRVLLVLAEEEPEEVQRMLHFACRAANLGESDLDEVCARVTPMDVTGLNVAMTGGQDNGATLPETPFARAVRDIAKQASVEGNPYIAIILDPLSYFGGFDVEKDTSAATRWIQVLRTLTTEECGKPSVFIAHHEKKRAADEQTSANVIRGVKALTDGVRWAAVLDQEKRTDGAADLLTLRVVKANGVPPRPPLILCRSHENEGILQVATRDEIDSHSGLREREGARVEKMSNYVGKIQKEWTSGQTTRAALIESCGNKQMTLGAIRQMLAEGLITEHPKGVLHLVPAGSREVPGTAKVPGSKVPLPPVGGRNLEPEPHSPVVHGSLVLEPLTVPEPPTRAA